MDRYNQDHWLPNSPTLSGLSSVIWSPRSVHELNDEFPDLDFSVVSRVSEVFDSVSRTWSMNDRFSETDFNMQPQTLDTRGVDSEEESDISDLFYEIQELRKRSIQKIR